jgi:hypothetical protein
MDALCTAKVVFGAPFAMRESTGYEAPFVSKNQTGTGELAGHKPAVSLFFEAQTGSGQSLPLISTQSGFRV